MCGTMYWNIDKAWKTNINLRSHGLNEHIVADSCLIKGGDLSKNSV